MIHKPFMYGMLICIEKKVENDLQKTLAKSIKKN